MRGPNHYQALKDSEAAPAADDANELEISNVGTPEADPHTVPTAAEKADADFAAKNEDLRQRFERGAINSAEFGHLTRKLDNEEVMRIQQEDRLDSGTAATKDQPSAASGDAQAEQPEPQAEASEAAPDQTADPGKEISESMQARLDRLHAAQSNAPRGFEGASRTNGNSGRGGGRCP